MKQILFIIVTSLIYFFVVYIFFVTQFSYIIELVV